jgi:hypothetical protein
LGRCKLLLVKGDNNNNFTTVSVDWNPVPRIISSNSYH